MKKTVALITTFLVAVCFGFCGDFSVSAVSDSAKASVVIDAFTGEIIYSKNCDEKLSMASTTKIMTALLLCEYGNLDREIKVTKEMVTVEGSSMGLLPDDTVTLRGLLYGMMLPSGNDAANSTAFVVGGSIEKFVELMNKKADMLGLKNTHFVTPSGLDADGHYTTAYELALLAAYALNNADFKAAAQSNSAVLYYGNEPYRRTLTNHNKLLKSYDGLIGVKTGFTKKSGRCLVTAAERDGKRIVAVTLNDPNDWEDHKNLLDYGFSQLITTNLDIVEKVLRICVVGGNKMDVNVNIPQVSVNTVGEKEITYEISSTPFLYAPIKKGQRVATLNVYADGDLIKSIELNSASQVDVREFTKYQKFKNIFLKIFYSV